MQASSYKDRSHRSRDGHSAPKEVGDKTPYANRNRYRGDEDYRQPTPQAGYPPLQARPRMNLPPLAITTHLAPERWAHDRLRSNRSYEDRQSHSAGRDWNRSSQTPMSNDRRWPSATGDEYWNSVPSNYGERQRDWSGSEGSSGRSEVVSGYRRGGEYDTSRSRRYPQSSGGTPSPPITRYSSRSNSQQPMSSPTGNQMQHSPLSPSLPAETTGKVRDPRILSGRVNPAASGGRASSSPMSPLSPTSSTSKSISPVSQDKVQPDKTISASKPSRFAPSDVSPSTSRSSRRSKSSTGPDLLPVPARRLSDDVDTLPSMRTDDESPGMLEEKQVYGCEHCSYVGKKIVPHYVNRHPGKEVPVRMSDEELQEALSEQKTPPSKAKSTQRTEEAPTTAALTPPQKSILDDLSWIPERSIFYRPVECKLCGYTTLVRTNLIQHCMAHRHPEKSSLPFATPVQLYCHFCEYSSSNGQDFCDHVTTHTGEFRYTCGYCAFRGFSSKSVRSHIACSHTGKSPYVRRDTDIKSQGLYLVGYVCQACRYIQLSESAVTKHINVSHARASRRPKVIQINMSRLQKLTPKKALPIPDSPLSPTAESPASPTEPSLGDDGTGDDDIVLLPNQPSRIIPLEPVKQTPVIIPLEKKEKPTKESPSAPKPKFERISTRQSARHEATLAQMKLATTTAGAATLDDSDKSVYKEHDTSSSKTSSSLGGKKTAKQVTDSDDSSKDADDEKRTKAKKEVVDLTEKKIDDVTEKPSDNDGKTTSTKASVDEASTSEEVAEGSGKVNENDSEQEDGGEEGEEEEADGDDDEDDEASDDSSEQDEGSQDETSEEEEDDDDEEDNVMVNSDEPDVASTGGGKKDLTARLSPSNSGSPPHLFPESNLDDSDADGSGGGKVAPSIAETVLRLQAMLKKTSKQRSLPPPVLEPIDTKVVLDHLSGHSSTSVTGDADDDSCEKLTLEFLYKCGARLCGFFTTKEEDFLAHLEGNHSPREAPCSECGGSFAQWKLLLKHLATECALADKALRFMCGLPSCLYYTSNEELFFSHVRNSHKKETQLPCKQCQKKFTLVTSLVTHIKSTCKAAKNAKSAVVSTPIQKHTGASEKLKANANENGDAPVSLDDASMQGATIPNVMFSIPPLHIVYECPFEACDHKSLERDVFRSHVVSLHANKPLPCLCCKSEFETVEPFMAHVESQHVEKEKQQRGTKRKRSDDEREANKKVKHDPEEVADDDKKKEETVPKSKTDDKVSLISKLKASTADDVGVADAEASGLKVSGRDIAELMSVSGSDDEAAKKPLPLEVSRMRDPAVEGLSMKDPKVLKDMLLTDKLKCLFKCMGTLCSYMSNSRSEFILHLSEGLCGGRTLCCYCLLECSSPSVLGEHLVASHGHCTFQCKHCFYRATTEEYVAHHQQLRHAGLPHGSITCERHPDATDPVNEPVNPEFVIPYRCAVGNCQYEVADPGEFRKHNHNEHSAVSIFPCHHCGVTCFNPERLLGHYKIHGCNNYQCGFCLHGSETDEEILFHLCSMHPNRRGRIIVRSMLLPSGKKLDVVEESSPKKTKVDAGGDAWLMTVATSSLSGMTSVAAAKDDEAAEHEPQATGTPSKRDGKVGHALFQCGYPPCAFSAATAEALREHMVTCTSSFKHPYAKCPHCPRQWRTVTIFLEHMVTLHGGRRFVCGRCPFRGTTQEFVQNHVKLQHGTPVEQTECVLRDPTSDPEVGEYVIQEMAAAVTPKKQPEQRKMERKAVHSRRGVTYGVDDIDRLPMQSIFTKECVCALCGYSTKVRSNLIRHLQFHRREELPKDTSEAKPSPQKGNAQLQSQQVPPSTPPVVSLSTPVVKSVQLPETNTQMEFEEPITEHNEMVTHMEFTIDADTSQCPQFIAATSLYRCDVDGCDYLALDTGMYRYHVSTLHPDKGTYACPHCKERVNSLDRLINHFRVHGPRLYKCGKCNYVSCRRHPVEAHNSSVHNNRFLPVVTVREPEVNEGDRPADVQNAPPEQQKATVTRQSQKTPPTVETADRSAPEPDGISVANTDRNVWCCALCQHTGATKMIIKNHLQSSHGVRSEFKCGVCSCVSNAFDSVRAHFVSRHPSQEIQIMPLIVKTKDFNPEKLLVNVPKDSIGKPDLISPGKQQRGSVATVARESPRGSMVTRSSSAAAESSSTSKETMISKPTHDKASTALPDAASTTPQAQNGLKIKIDLKGNRSRSTSRDSPTTEDTAHEVSKTTTAEGMPTDAPESDASFSLPAAGASGVSASSAIGKVVFQCPVCKDYKTKFRGDMRIHMYRELQYRRIQCALCKTLFVSEKEAKHHSVKTHRGRVPSLIKTEIPEKEEWVKEQLDAQVRAWGSTPRHVRSKSEEADAAPDVQADTEENVVEVKQSSTQASSEPGPVEPVPFVEKFDISLEGERHFRYYCPQCNYQCEGTTDLRKHIFRHMKFKPFLCKYCSTRFSEKQQIRNHHTQQHPEEEFFCDRDSDLEPERYVDELLQQQRLEWRDKKKSMSPVKLNKSVAQMSVAKLADDSEVTVTSKSGASVFHCQHEGCNFTCDQLKGLKVHIMSHLRKIKFRCGYCTLTGVSQYQMRRHCSSAHAGRKVLVLSLKVDAPPPVPTPLPLPPSPPPPPTATATMTTLPPVLKGKMKGRGSRMRGFRQHQCRYCPYTHTLPKMILRHQMRHYVEKPFQCGYCKRTGIERFDVLSHCRKVHPNCEPKVIATPIPNNPEIRPILRRGGSFQPKSVGDENEEKEHTVTQSDEASKPAYDGAFVMTDAPTTGSDSQFLNSVVQTRRTYQCNLCQTRLNSKEEIKSHLMSSHNENGPRYRVIVTARKSAAPAVVSSDEDKNSAVGLRTSTTLRTSLLKCMYCDLASDSLKMLRKHCHDTHTGSDVRLLKLAQDWEPSGESVLRCGYCGFAGSKMSSLWDHHVGEHEGSSVNFRVSVRKNAANTAALKGRKGKAGGAGGQGYVCSYCNDQCATLDKMMRHWKMFHGHLELKYKGPTDDDDGSLSDKMEVVFEEGAELSDDDCGLNLKETSTKLVDSAAEQATTGVKVYGCAQCKYESDKYDMVRQHLFRHLQRFVCPRCQKYYPFEYEVKKHVETHHAGEKVDIMKNPRYSDQEKDDLIRNIRVRFVDSEKAYDFDILDSRQCVAESLEIVMQNDDPLPVITEIGSPTPTSPRKQQTARKSISRTIPGTLGETKWPHSRMSAKKSTNRKINPPSLKWQLLAATMADTRSPPPTLDSSACEEETGDDVVVPAEKPVPSKIHVAKPATKVETETTTAADDNERMLSTPPAKVARLEHCRVSLSLVDLYEMVNLLPDVVVECCDKLLGDDDSSDDESGITIVECDDGNTPQPEEEETQPCSRVPEKTTYPCDDA